MSGSISQFSGPVALPATMALPSANAPGGTSLAVFIDLMTGKAATPAMVAAPSGDERQEDAAPGKSLPPKDKIDPALAWLFGAPPTVVPPATVAIPQGPAPILAATPTVSAGGSAPQLGAAGIASGPAAAPAAVIEATSRAETPSVLPIGDMPVLLAALSATKSANSTAPVDAPSAPVPIIVSRDATGPSAVIPPATAAVATPAVSAEGAPQTRSAPAGPVQLAAAVRIVPPEAPRSIAEGPASPTPMVAGKASNAAVSSAVPLPIVPITTAPSQSAPIILPALFALAMAAGPRPADQDDTPLATPGSAEFQPLAVSLAAIAPPGDAQRQSLDMGQRDWPQKMIDHIEALRDNANANDTSIRLKPDALGQVDVALKTHEDGAISVRFIAEQPTTRTLIADAAPQLAQAAEARGIRLSGTSVDLTGQGGDPRSQAELERRQPITNHLTAPSGDDGEPVADDRVA